MPLLCCYIAAGNLRQALYLIINENKRLDGFFYGSADVTKHPGVHFRQNFTFKVEIQPHNMAVQQVALMRFIRSSEMGQYLTNTVDRDIPNYIAGLLEWK